MDWSAQQTSALEAIHDWLGNPSGEPIFRLFGYAGTGKTTLIREIIKMEAERGGYAQPCAFTGKAALVLRQKGAETARTIHSILYNTQDKSREELLQLREEYEIEYAREPSNPERIRELRQMIDSERIHVNKPGFSLKEDPLSVWSPYEEGEVREKIATISLFVVDECSMVYQELGEDLMAPGARALVIGDPAQLPPVRDSGGFFLKTHPNVLLTEIHRQAQGNPIIELAQTVRKGAEMSIGDYGPALRIVARSHFKKADWWEADEIICWRNATRRYLNKRLRHDKGHSHSPLPIVGERLICLDNKHNLGLMNGSICELIEVRSIGDHTMDIVVQNLDFPSSEPIAVKAHQAWFLAEGGTEPLFDLAWQRKEAIAFDFGYVLTAHKAQGSQWPYVIYVDEAPWPLSERSKHQYTGITRAQSRLTVVKWYR